MVLTNLTAFDVTIVGGDEEIVIPASGFVAACVYKLTEVKGVNDIPVVRAMFSSVDGLPAPSDGVAYIVNRNVAKNVPDREDLFYPSDPVRNIDGEIVGYRALGVI